MTLEQVLEETGTAQTTSQWNLLGKPLTFEDSNVSGFTTQTSPSLTAQGSETLDQMFEDYRSGLHQASFTDYNSEPTYVSDDPEFIKRAQRFKTASRRSLHLTLPEIFNSPYTSTEKLIASIKRIREGYASRNEQLQFLNNFEDMLESDHFREYLHTTDQRILEKTGTKNDRRVNYMVKILRKSIFNSPQPKRRRNTAETVKILRFSHDYLVNTGGLQTHLQELNKAIVDTGEVEVHHAMPMKRSALRGLIRDGSLTRVNDEYFHRESNTVIHPIILDFDTERPQMNKSSIRSQYKKQISPLLDKVDADIVHVHNGYYLPHFDAAREAKNRGLKVFNSWHGSDILNQNLRDVHKETEKLADVNLAVTSVGASTFSSNDVHVLYGVDQEFFTDESSIMGYKRLEHKLKDDFIFLSSARYCEQKNQLGLVDAFAKIAKDNDKAKLVCMGQKYDQDGGYVSKLEQKIAENGLQDQVILLDRQNKKSVREWYDTADCLVYNSINEGRGRSFAEAMSMGKTLIASTDAGLVDNLYYNGQEVGFGIDPKNTQELANTMKYVIDNPKEAKRRADLAKEFAANELEVGNYAQKLIGLYKNSLGKDL